MEIRTESSIDTGFVWWFIVLVRVSENQRRFFGSLYKTGSIILESTSNLLFIETPLRCSRRLEGMDPYSISYRMVAPNSANDAFPILIRRHGGFPLKP